MTTDAIDDSADDLPDEVRELLAPWRALSEPERLALERAAAADAGTRDSGLPGEAGEDFVVRYSGDP